MNKYQHMIMSVFPQKVQTGVSDVTAHSLFAVIFVSVYRSISYSHCLWLPCFPLSRSPTVSLSVHLSLSPLHHFLTLKLLPLNSTETSAFISGGSVADHEHSARMPHMHNTPTTVEIQADTLTSTLMYSLTHMNRLPHRQA